jgi:hypothetical protein
MSSDPLEVAWTPGCAFPSTAVAAATSIPSGSDENHRCESHQRGEAVAMHRKRSPGEPVENLSRTSTPQEAHDGAKHLVEAPCTAPAQRVSATRERGGVADAAFTRRFPIAPPALASASLTMQDTSGFMPECLITGAKTASPPPDTTRTSTFNTTTTEPPPAKTHDSGCYGDFTSLQLLSPLSELVRGAALREDADAPFLRIPEELLRRAVPTAMSDRPPYESAEAEAMPMLLSGGTVSSRCASQINAGGSSGQRSRSTSTTSSLTSVMENPGQKIPSTAVTVPLTATRSHTSPSSLVDLTSMLEASRAIAATLMVDPDAPHPKVPLQQQQQQQPSLRHTPVIPVMPPSRLAERTSTAATEEENAAVQPRSIATASPTSDVQRGLMPSPQSPLAPPTTSSPSRSNDDATLPSTDAGAATSSTSTSALNAHTTAEADAPPITTVPLVMSPVSLHPGPLTRSFIAVANAATTAAAERHDVVGTPLAVPPPMAVSSGLLPRLHPTHLAIKPAGSNSSNASHSVESRPSTTGTLSFCLPHSPMSPGPAWPQERGVTPFVGSSPPHLVEAAMSLLAQGHDAPGRRPSTHSRESQRQPTAPPTAATQHQRQHSSLLHIELARPVTSVASVLSSGDRTDAPFHFEDLLDGTTISSFDEETTRDYAAGTNTDDDDDTTFDDGDGTMRRGRGHGSCSRRDLSSSSRGSGRTVRGQTRRSLPARSGREPQPHAQQRRQERLQQLQEQQQQQQQHAASQMQLPSSPTAGRGFNTIEAVAYNNEGHHHTPQPHSGLCSFEMPTFSFLGGEGGAGGGGGAGAGAGAGAGIPAAAAAASLVAAWRGRPFASPRSSMASQPFTSDSASTSTSSHAYQPLEGAGGSTHSGSVTGGGAALGLPPPLAHGAAAGSRTAQVTSAGVIGGNAEAASPVTPAAPGVSGRSDSGDTGVSTVSTTAAAGASPREEAPRQRTPAGQRMLNVYYSARLQSHTQHSESANTTITTTSTGASAERSAHSNDVLDSSLSVPEMPEVLPGTTPHSATEPTSSIMTATTTPDIPLGRHHTESPPVAFASPHSQPQLTSPPASAANTTGMLAAENASGTAVVEAAGRQPHVEDTPAAADSRGQHRDHHEDVKAGAHVERRPPHTGPWKSTSVAHPPPLKLTRRPAAVSAVNTGAGNDTEGSESEAGGVVQRPSLPGKATPLSTGSARGSAAMSASAGGPTAAGTAAGDGSAATVGVETAVPTEVHATIASAQASRSTTRHPDEWPVGAVQGLQPRTSAMAGDSNLVSPSAGRRASRSPPSAGGFPGRSSGSSGHGTSADRSSPTSPPSQPPAAPTPVQEEANTAISSASIATAVSLGFELPGTSSVPPWDIAAASVVPRPGTETVMQPHQPSPSAGGVLQKEHPTARYGVGGGAGGGADGGEGQSAGPSTTANGEHQGVAAAGSPRSANTTHVDAADQQQQQHTHDGGVDRPERGGSRWYHRRFSSTWRCRLLWILLPYGIFVAMLALATFVATHIVAQGIVSHSWNELHTYMRSELVAFMEEVTLMPVMAGEIMTGRRTKDAAHPMPTDPPRPPIANVSRALCAALKFTDLRKSMVSLTYASVSSSDPRDDVVYVPRIGNSGIAATAGPARSPDTVADDMTHVTAALAHPWSASGANGTRIGGAKVAQDDICPYIVTEMSDVDGRNGSLRSSTAAASNTLESDPELQTAFAFCDAGNSTNYFVVASRESVRRSQRDRLKQATVFYAVNASTLDVAHPLRKIRQTPPCYDGNTHARFSHVLPIVHAWKEAVARRDGSQLRVARWWISSEPFEHSSVMYVHPFYEYGRREPSYVSCRIDAEALLRGYLAHQRQQQQSKKDAPTQARVMLLVPRRQRQAKRMSPVMEGWHAASPPLMDARATTPVEARILARSWALDMEQEARRAAATLPERPRRTPPMSGAASATLASCSTRAECEDRYAGLRLSTTEVAEECRSELSTFSRTAAEPENNNSNHSHDINVGGDEFDNPQWLPWALRDRRTVVPHLDDVGDALTQAALTVVDVQAYAAKMHARLNELFVDGSANDAPVRKTHWRDVREIATQNLRGALSAHGGAAATTLPQPDNATDYAEAGAAPKLGDGRRTFMPSVFREFYFNGQRAAVSVSAVQLRSNFTAMVVLVSPLVTTQGRSLEAVQRYLAAAAVAVVAAGATFLVYLVLTHYLQLPLISIQRQLECVVVARPGKSAAPSVDGGVRGVSLFNLSSVSGVRRQLGVEGEKADDASRSMMCAEGGDDRLLLLRMSHAVAPADPAALSAVAEKSNSDGGSPAPQPADRSGQSTEGEEASPHPVAGLTLSPSSLVQRARLALFVRARWVACYLAQLRLAEVAELQDVCGDLHQHVRDMQQYIPENYNFDNSSSGFAPSFSAMTGMSPEESTRTNSGSTHPLPGYTHDSAATSSLSDSLASSLFASQYSTGPRSRASPPSTGLHVRLQHSKPAATKTVCVNVINRVHSHASALSTSSTCVGSAGGTSAVDVRLPAPATRSTGGSGSGGGWGLSRSSHSLLHPQSSLSMAGTMPMVESAALFDKTVTPPKGSATLQHSRGGAPASSAEAPRGTAQREDTDDVSATVTTTSASSPMLHDFFVSTSRDDVNSPHLRCKATRLASAEAPLLLHCAAAEVSRRTVHPRRAAADDVQSQDSAPHSPPLTPEESRSHHEHVDEAAQRTSSSKKQLESSTTKPAAATVQLLHVLATPFPTPLPHLCAALPEVSPETYTEASSPPQPQPQPTVSEVPPSSHGASTETLTNITVPSSCSIAGSQRDSKCSDPSSTLSVQVATSASTGTSTIRDSNSLAPCCFSKCFCTLLCIHVHVNESTDVLEQFPEIMETVVECVHRYGGVFDLFLPEFLYASFGSRVRTKDHAVTATRCGIEIFSRLSTHALRYMTFVIDTGVYSVGVCGVPEHKGIVLWGRPSSELLFEQQFQSGLRFLVTDSVVPLIRRRFRVLPVDVVTIQDEEGKLHLVLYVVLVGSVEVPWWEGFSQLAQEAFLHLIRGNFEAACPLYERLIHSPSATFTTILQYLLAHERVLMDNKTGLSPTELARQSDELTVTCVTELARERMPIVVPFGTAMPWLAGHPELLRRFSDEDRDDEEEDGSDAATRVGISGSGAVKSSGDDVATSTVTSAAAAAATTTTTLRYSHSPQWLRRTSQPLGQDLSVKVDTPWHPLPSTADAQYSVPAATSTNSVAAPSGGTVSVSASTRGFSAHTSVSEATQAARRSGDVISTTTLTELSGVDVAAITPTSAASPTSEDSFPQQRTAQERQGLTEGTSNDAESPDAAEKRRDRLCTATRVDTSCSNTTPPLQQQQRVSTIDNAAEEDVDRIMLPKMHFNGIELRVKDLSGRTWQLASTPVGGVGAPARLDTSLAFLGISPYGSMAEIWVYPMHHAGTADSLGKSSAALSVHIGGPPLTDAAQPPSSPAAAASHSADASAGESAAADAEGNTTGAAAEQPQRSSSCSTNAPAGVDLDAMLTVERWRCQANMVQLLSVAVTATHIYTIMEWVAGRTLQDTVNRFGSRLAMITIRNCCASVLRALDYLHNSRGIVHGRIHPDNILFGVEGTCKLTGMLFLYDWALPDPGLHAKLIRIPAAYRSPEVNAGAAPTPASDIYAFGLLLLQMLTGEVPWAWSDLSESSMDGKLELRSVIQDDSFFLEAVKAGVLKLRQYGTQPNQYSLSVEAQQRQQLDKMGGTGPSSAGTRKRTPAVVDWEGDKRGAAVGNPGMLRLLEACLADAPSQRKGAAGLRKMLSEL